MWYQLQNQSGKVLRILLPVHLLPVSTGGLIDGVSVDTPTGGSVGFSEESKIEHLISKLYLSDIQSYYST